MACAPSEDSDQPGHPPSLIRVFAVPVRSVFAVRSLSNQGPNASSCGQRRLWSDWADVQADQRLRWAHMSYCWFYRAVLNCEFSSAHRESFKRVRDVALCLKLPLVPFTVYLNSECSGETERESLVTYMIRIIFSWTGSIFIANEK